MGDLLFFRSESTVRAVVDGLEIAQYSDWGGGQFHVVVDGHLNPHQFRRGEVADSEAKAQHWIRSWWQRDEAVIRAGFAKVAAERLARLELERARPAPRREAVPRGPVRRHRGRR